VAVSGNLAMMAPWGQQENGRVEPLDAAGRTECSHTRSHIDWDLIYGERWVRAGIGAGNAMGKRAWSSKASKDWYLSSVGGQVGGPMAGGGGYSREGGSANKKIGLGAPIARFSRAGPPSWCKWQRVGAER
jgi:hypothetical protein